MYPAQTSLIPATVALAKFLEANGAGGVYPFWYLGTTPFKYLTGPVVPYLLVSLRTVLSPYSYFDLALVLILIGFVIEAIGWGIFALRLRSGSSTGILSGNRRVGWLVGILVLIMPWHIVSALGLSEVSAVMAGSFTPWVLLAFQRFTIHDSRLKNLLPPALVFAILLLTNSTASVSVIIGLLIFSFSTFNSSSFAKTSEDKQLSILKRAFAVILLGWLLTLWWYSPGYWLTIWGAPGIGGKNVLGVLSTFINFMRGFLPVIAALLFVFWRVKPKTVFEKFRLGWLVLFGSLTLFRFMADWDFWMDWTAWIGEVEVGVALLSAKWIQDSRFKIQDLKAGLFLNPKSLIIILLILDGWFLAWQNRGFWLPRSTIVDSVEYRIANELQRIVKPDETVFLSGTSAFWLNSLADVRQVRGGRDEGSVDSNWREAVWEVREGEYGRDSVDILKGLGVDYLVVHTDESSEYYHDFKYPEKFEGRVDLEKVYGKDGDVIYRVR